MNRLSLLLSFFVLLQVSNAFSQPVINKLYDYKPGMTYNYFKIPSGTVLDTTLLPSYGANLEWNLDLLPWENIMFTDSILSYEQSSKLSAFENCDFVYKEYGGIEQFYRKSNDTLMYMGNSSANQQFLPNPITVVYPTVYDPSGFNFSDYQTNVPGLSVPWSYSGRYNAFGTLTLGGNAYPNTALFINKGGKPGQWYIEYMWVNEGDIFPKVRVQFAEINNYVTVNFAYGLASVISGFEDTHSKSNLKLYPNPSSNQVFVNLGQENEYVTMKQFDCSGRLITEKSCFSMSTLSFDLAGKPGIYFLQITQENKKTQTLKVIKK